MTFFLGLGCDHTSNLLVLGSVLVSGSQSDCNSVLAFSATRAAPSKILHHMGKL